MFYSVVQNSLYKIPLIACLGLFLKLQPQLLAKKGLCDYTHYTDRIAGFSKDKYIL